MQNTPPVYPALTDSYQDNVALFDRILRVEESFDLIKKPLKVGQDEMTLYYIDGFIKDTVMMKLMMSFLALDGMDLPVEGGTGSVGSVTEETHPAPALRFCARALPYVETDVTDSTDTAVQMVLSGAAVMVGSPFGRGVVIIDARTYPARDTTEPEGDKVMRGARDGFVETLIFNTALLAPKATRSAQGVAVMTLKPKWHLESVKDLEETPIQNKSRYRVRSLPAAGALLRQEDTEEQQMELL